MYPIFLASTKKMDEYAPKPPIIRRRFLKIARDVDVRAVGGNNRLACVDNKSNVR